MDLLLFFYFFAATKNLGTAYGNLHACSASRCHKTYSIALFIREEKTLDLSQRKGDTVFF